MKLYQYVQITEKDIEEVRTIYHKSWEMLKRTGNVKEVLYNYHYPKLSEWLSKYYPSELRNILRNQKTINKVTCEEYSPEFQIGILRLNEMKYIRANNRCWLRRKWKFSQEIKGVWQRYNRDSTEL